MVKKTFFEEESDKPLPSSNYLIELLPEGVRITSLVQEEVDQYPELDFGDCFEGEIF